MVGGLSSVVSQISQVYEQNSSLLADTYARIASGKRVMSPSDDFVSYSKIRTLNNDVDKYQKVKRDLSEAQAVANVAVEAGNQVYDALQKMKDLANRYAATSDADEQSQLATEFSQVVANVDEIIANSSYEDTQVLSAATISSVAVNPYDTSNDTIEMTFVAGDIAAVTGFALGTETEADVDTEIDKVVSYLSKAQGFQSLVDSSMSVTDSILNSNKSAISALEDINEAEEMSKQVDLQIRQQAAVAMMSQANVSRQGIMQLYL